MYTFRKITNIGIPSNSRGELPPNFNEENISFNGWVGRLGS